MRRGPRAQLQCGAHTRHPRPPAPSIRTGTPGSPCALGARPRGGGWLALAMASRGGVNAEPEGDADPTARSLAHGEMNGARRLRRTSRQSTPPRSPPPSRRRRHCPRLPAAPRHCALRSRRAPAASSTAPAGGRCEEGEGREEVDVEAGVNLNSRGVSQRWRLWQHTSSRGKQLPQKQLPRHSASLLREQVHGSGADDAC